VSVTAGSATIATNLQYPNATDYQAVAPGAATVKVSTQTANASATMQVNFAAGGTYTVVVADGTGSAPQILDLSDASGIGVPPKGGVNTGFGGAAVRPGGSVFPVYPVVLLIVAGAAVAFGMSRRRGSIG
jgi:hypothetical protein